MQYTIRGVPAEVDRALRARALEAGTSLNEIALDALAEAAGVGLAGRQRRTLSDVTGTWEQEDRVVDALADQDRVDEALWR